VTLVGCLTLQVIDTKELFGRQLLQFFPQMAQLVNVLQRNLHGLYICYAPVCPNIILGLRTAKNVQTMPCNTEWSKKRTLYINLAITSVNMHQFQLFLYCYIKKFIAHKSKIMPTSCIL